MSRELDAEVAKARGFYEITVFDVMSSNGDDVSEWKAFREKESKNEKIPKKYSGMLLPMH